MNILNKAILKTPFGIKTSFRIGWLYDPFDLIINDFAAKSHSIDNGKKI